MAPSSVFVSELPHTSQVASHLLSPFKYINIIDDTPPGTISFMFRKPAKAVIANLAG